MDRSGKDRQSGIVTADSEDGVLAVRLLICENERGDFLRLTHLLEQIDGRRFETEWTRTLDDSIEALHQHGHDVALVDHRLIGGSGFDVLLEAIAIDWPAPIIMMTGLKNPEIDHKAMKLGASDFLDKDELSPSILDRSIRYSVERKRMEAPAAQTNRELFQYLTVLREAKAEIELQNRRIVSLAYHLASASHDPGIIDGGASVTPKHAICDPDRLGTWRFDAAGRTLAANATTLALFELKDERALAGRSMEDLVSEASRGQFFDAMSRLESEAVITMEIELVGQCSGRRRWVVLSLLAAVDEQGARHFSATIVDITSRRNIETEIRYLAKHDSLTGLANRVSFNESLNQAVRIARRNGSLVGLFCVDLDSFKQVNDTLGHQAGDRLLVLAAERLCEVMRESDAVARLGGDEFGVIATNLASREDAVSTAEKITAVLDEPFEVRGQSVTCGASVAVAVFPEDSEDLEDLFDHADSVLYRRKRARAQETNDPSSALSSPSSGKRRSALSAG